MGFHISALFAHSLFMLGQAAGGVALFATGILLACGWIRVNWRILSDECTVADFSTRSRTHASGHGRRSPSRQGCKAGW